MAPRFSPPLRSKHAEDTGEGRREGRKESKGSEKGEAEGEKDRRKDEREGDGGEGRKGGDERREGRKEEGGEGREGREKGMKDRGLGLGGPVLRRQHSLSILSSFFYPHHHLRDQPFLARPSPLPPNFHFDISIHCLSPEPLSL